MVDEPQPLSLPERVKYIRKNIIAAGSDIKQRFPVLKYQNAIGLGILLFALFSMVVVSALYLNQQIPWWLCLLLNALCLSLAHEIEHDLIHSLYFKKNRFMYHLMMALVWIVRPSSANPWARKTLHLKHHQYSGSELDIEERALSNGTRWGVLRLLMTADLMVAMAVVAWQDKDKGDRLGMVMTGIKAFFPVAMLTWGLWYLFLLVHGVDVAAALLGMPIAWSVGTQALIGDLDMLVVVLIGPNILWSFCLHFVSSNMHYHGDVEHNNLLQQTQVMNPWWLWPLQLFCFNFGSTHSIHHFVVNEPFYIRQLTAAKAHRVMREMGVRFNDYGSFSRANRWKSTG
ncbi:fatty acid desaturase [Serratia rubidaea]|uniref:fatty acid desaturase n=1 Tax=Serratia rubidaea TaxID=61652 RepID=UPI001F338D77|nr:fatty acid desaturase [Serratia rubidaea]UJD80695.1 fatty acid desaturase [Serratia rubidaea]UJD85251.1 fatty acid desaturase [Serratia rubidaea]